MYMEDPKLTSLLLKENTLKPRIPESFNVLTKELQSLGLSVKLLKNGDKMK